MIEWIRESNLIEGVDDPLEDKRCERVWKELQDKDFSENTILWLHRRIMRKLNPRIAGKYRKCGVRVGTYIAPSYVQIERLMKNWLWYAVFKKVENIKKAHIDFEHIHPFEDGNGRVGRMLMNWQRVKAGLDPLLIKASERHQYYQWF